MSEHRFSTPAELDQALATAVVRRLEEDIRHLDRATLVVSGGSTPKGLFRILSNTAIAWEQVTVLLADERWVPLDHADSNEAMVRRELLQDRAASAALISLIPRYPDAVANLATVSARLNALDPFSAVILGMGGDSHTASLFPCCAELETGLTTPAPVLMTHPTTAPHARVSLSRTRLQKTRAGFIHIVGESKLAVLQDAAQHSDPMTHPIAAFLKPPRSFEVWYAPA